MDRFHKFEDFHQTVLRKYFPNARKSTIGGLYRFDDEGPYSEANFGLHLGNNLIKNTTFQPRNANRFIHFTSLESMLSILKEQVIRMYSLETMNDPSEMSVFVRDRPELAPKVNNYKKNIWVFSFCNAIVEDNLSSLHMWREYSSNGKGCSFEFKFQPGIDYDYFQFIIAKISYDPKSKFREKFLTDCEDYLNANSLHIRNFNQMLGVLSPFFKEKVFAYEREFRLVYLPSEPDANFNVKYSSYTKSANDFGLIKDYKRGSLTSYYPLQINLPKIKSDIENQVVKLMDGGDFFEIPGERLNAIKLFKRLNELKPKIEITKIILGPGLGVNEKYEFSLLVSELYKNVYNKSVDIVDSKLTKYFV